MEKNGSGIGQSTRSYTVESPGEYCVTWVNTNTGCTSEEKCVNFVWGACHAPGPIPRLKDSDNAIEGKASQISIYPNPTSGTLNLKGNDQFSRFQILDVTGRVVLEGNSSQSSIEVTSFKNGIYLINFLDENAEIIESKKFVKN